MLTIENNMSYRAAQLLLQILLYLVDNPFECSRYN